MGRNTVFSLSFLFLFCILCDCYAIESVTQKTTREQSPAILADHGAKVNVKYTTIINQSISEANSEFSKCLEFATAFQNQKLADLSKTIAVLLAQNEGVSDEDADKWAKEMIEKAPRVKTEIENNNARIKKYNEEFSKNLLAKVYIAFAYILETVDSKFLAIKKLSPKATYNKDDRFDLFSDKTTQIKSYVVRSFVFPNGSRITITLTPGIIKDGIIQACPSLAFTESVEYVLMQSFKINPNYGTGMIRLGGGVELKKEKVAIDVNYPATGADILTEQFKGNLNKAFTEFIQLASTR